MMAKKGYAPKIVIKSFIFIYKMKMITAKHSFILSFHLTAITLRLHPTK